jgi:phenylpropionate dioxygenase-like ring-hydroxylating dioxygenase large terminal subunit
VGAYIRFYERRVEKELKERATRGITPPPQPHHLGTPREGAAITDRRQAVPALGLKEYWYPALPARKVKKDKPLYWQMLGEELALFRDKEGHVAAVSDVCPHRGASMSKGDCFYEGTISCPYHGATFDQRGECVAFLPEGPDSKMPGNLRIKTYPTRTLRGWVFIWMGEGEAAPIEEDVPPELFDEKSTIFLTTYTYWPTNWMLAIENQNDSHNGFYVHRNSMMQLTMYRGRSRTPLGPRTKLIDDRALTPLMKNQNHYADPATGKEPLQLYYPGVDGHWPFGKWRTWVWNAFKPWYRLVYNPWRLSPKRYPYTAPEEWAATVGVSAWHLPCHVRVNFGVFSYTRAAVPVTADLSRVIYFHHRKRAPFGLLGEAVQRAWFYAYFNWWLHYNFSGQDSLVAAPCRYWTQENLSATDSHLVMLRKLVTERSRDAKRARAAAADLAGQVPEGDLRFFREQAERGVALEQSLEEAAAHTESAPALDFVVGAPRRGRQAQEQKE